MTGKTRGSHLNQLWRVGAAHALYIHDGHWYHRLERFPGALFDRNGYIVFATEEEYRASPYLHIGKQVSIRRPGISAIPGYVRVVGADQSQEPALALRVVAAKTAEFPTVAEASPGFTFRPGWTTRRRSTVATLSAREVDIELRHNELQDRLYQALVARHGVENVGTEQLTRDGLRVDVVLRVGEEYWFFEIKTALSARACIREALAQLLEYAYWPGAQEAIRLVVIGEPALDPEAAIYLERLRSRFALPIDYQQINLAAENLSTEAS